MVHTPDLPLISGEPKFGFGLWKNKNLTFTLEATLLFWSLYYYMRNTKAISSFGKYAAAGFVAFLILVNFLNFYILPQDDNLVSVVTSALVVYFLFVGIAFWLNTKRN